MTKGDSMDLSDFLFEKNIKIINESIDKDGLLNEIAKLASSDESTQNIIFEKLKEREEWLEDIKKK